LVAGKPVYYIVHICSLASSFLSSNQSLFFSQEIQSKRQERKRRTTANPVYSGAVFEPEVLQPALALPHALTSLMAC
jgi:hypothetical protein